jgi:peptidoglycan/LPS O-acetylase OafA/YrhL
MPPAFAGYGFHGVVLFFILSGYLITKILLQTSDTSGGLPQFYVRRALRIWPLMLVALAVGAWWQPGYANSAAYNFLLINNFSMGFGIEPVFRTDVMWSLAIEEQFYLIWPLLICVIDRKYIPYLISFIIFLGLSFDAKLIPSMSGIPLYKTTYGCMQYIALGAAIAFGRKGLVSALTAIAAFLIFFYVKHTGRFWEDVRYIWWGITLLLFLFTYFTVHVRPIIHSSFLAFSGRLCYGLYIIHFFCSEVAWQYIGRGIVLAGSFYVVSSYALAIASFYIIEKPALQLRAPIEASQRAKLVLLIGILLLALGSLASIVSRVPPH